MGVDIDSSYIVLMGAVVGCALVYFAFFMGGGE